MLNQFDLERLAMERHQDLLGQAAQPRQVAPRRGMTLRAKVAVALITLALRIEPSVREMPANDRRMAGVPP